MESKKNSKVKNGDVKDEDLEDQDNKFKNGVGKNFLREGDREEIISKRIERKEDIAKKKMLRQLL